MSDHSIISAVDKVARMIKALRQSQSDTKREKTLNLAKLDHDIVECQKIIQSGIVPTTNVFQSIKFEGDLSLLTINKLNELISCFIDSREKFEELYDKKIANLANAELEHEREMESRNLGAIYQTAKIMVEDFHY